VRGLVNLPFEGDTYPEATILAVTEFPFHEHLEGLSHVNYCWKNTGTFSLLRLPGIWRTSLYPDPGEAHEDALKPESIERKLQQIVPRNQAYDVLEIRDYRIHRRLVPHFRVGRVALAGDAAHVHSPSGGMGLNGGIHDAFALSDALLKILNGGDESLLDLYSRQRRWVAEQGNLKISHQNRSRMQEKDPQKRREELAALQVIATDRDKCFDYVYKSSMFWGLDRAREIT
jgi:3-(3-hydroxy-phenyl)propionate hydroxylase